ncbi:YggS family pyridoxal phosphate-dependent enzyme [Thorsellia anophelis]|uniref:Pyridoxal phosphate homeostasis protein n=1 Tax=Thorsellia anophelis DSM 18579 TaxID=1123402 RepID=A0A1H9YE51_9GAMM|nr:YggS family pyridoxal phosphate-dependent enzyme [Thorsellia anophelis]SES66831.1 hypothetical protein SAMN02583745_00191 [Thorsellia anophelis DSM 18579]
MNTTQEHGLIAEQLSNVRKQIAQSALQYGRNPTDITLLAVSKTKSIDQIEHAIHANQNEFGENYVQEGIEKIQYFETTPYREQLIWHFIGPLQSNKSKYIAQHFDWLHTLDNEKLAKRLGAQRPLHLPRLNVLIQVNISGEETKSGIDLDEVDTLVQCVLAETTLCFRGLMTIPAPIGDNPTDEKIQQHYLSLMKLTDKFKQLQQEYPHHQNCQIDTLSMGMSDDLSVAIRAGSTLVRVGSAIFGART